MYLLTCSNNFGGKRFGWQNMFGGENIGGLSTYTEGNKGKTKKVASRTLGDQRSTTNSATIFYHQSLLYSIADSFSIVAAPRLVVLFCV